MRRLEWERERSKFCDSNKDGTNKRADSALNSEMTGSNGLCARTICGAGICPADGTWLPARIPSNTINHLCVTRFPRSLILALHHGCKKVHPHAFRFLCLPRGLRIRAPLSEGIGCYEGREVTRVDVRLSVPIWTFLHPFQFVYFFDW